MPFEQDYTHDDNAGPNTGGVGVQVHTPSRVAEMREIPPQQVAPVAGRTTTDLLFAALEKGISASDLASLAGLHKDMQQIEAQKDFTAAMARFQAKVGPIKKNRGAGYANTSGGNTQYSFATLDHIAHHCQPFLVAEGLMYSWNEKVDKELLVCQCTVRHVNGGSNSATTSMPTNTNAGMSPQQKYASASTFARRLSLTSALGLTTTDEDFNGAETGGGNTDVITANQVDTLMALLAQKGRTAKRLNEHFKIEHISDMLASDYNKAFSILAELPDRVKGDKGGAAE